MKIQVNNKPLSQTEKARSKRKQRLNEKFKSMDELMEYVEELEIRISKLEKR